MKILVKFPSRERPNKFFERIEQLNRLSDNNDNYLIMATLDSNDESMNNDAVRTKMATIINLDWVYGESKGKIDAVNRDMDMIEYPWDIVMVMSDDMIPQKKGWDTEIIYAFIKVGLDSVCHWPDGCPYQDKLITMSIMGRTYYDRFNYLYNPEYISLWCDNEFGDVAKMLGRYHYFGGVGHKNCLFHHFHPAHVKGAVVDELLKKTESFYHEDAKTYNKRKSRNFDI